MQNRVFRVHVCWAHGTIVCRTTKPAGGQTGPRSLNLTYKSALRISPPRRAALLQHPLRKWFSGSPAGPGNAISPRGTRKKRGPISKIFLLRSDNPVCRAVASFATRDFAEWFAQPFPTPWWGGRRPPPPGGGAGVMFWACNKHPIFACPRFGFRAVSLFIRARESRRLCRRAL